jgi:glycosyltransferase involved in cell wall biosynthesis
MRMAMTPLVSIVIASHREDCIKKCLEGFTGSVAACVAFEIIVVCDYGHERVSKKFPGVHWIYHSARSISEKRNVGIISSSGGIVGFIDDDCIPMQGWIERACGYLENNHSLAGVEGRTIVEENYRYSYPVKEFKRLEKRGFRTNNIFYRKVVLESVGGFDERFTVQREDADLAFSIMEKGLDIGYCPDINVMHRHRDGEPWDLLKNCRNRMFDPLLYKKHPASYRRWIGSPLTPAINIMAITHIAAVVFCICGTGFIVAAITDAAVAIALSVRRNNSNLRHLTQLFFDAVSYFLSPFVLMSSLMLGSIKFKKILAA